MNPIFPKLPRPQSDQTLRQEIVRRMLVINSLGLIKLQRAV